MAGPADRNSLSSLRAWAAKPVPGRRAAPPPAAPGEPKVVREETAAARRHGVTARPWFTGAAKDQSPAEKRRAEQNQILRHQLATSGPAGWASDHHEEAGQCSGWVYVATDARAKRVAAAELTVYRQDPDVPGEAGRRPVKPSHPLRRLLDRPNPKYDLGGLLYRVEMQLCLTGVALVWAPKNGLGRPAELWALPTALCRPVPPSAEYPEGAFQVSTITLSMWTSYAAGYWNTPAGAPLTIDAREFVKLTYPHPLTEADGLSPVHANGQAIDVARETDEALWSVLEQGPMPAYILSADPTMTGLTEETCEEVSASVEAKFGGARNAGKVMMLKGVTPQQMTFSPSDVIPGDLRNQNRDNVLAMHGVPAVAAGVSEATAYSGLYAALQQFDEQQVGPECRFVAGGLSLQLAPRFDDPALRIGLAPPKLNDPERVRADRQQAAAEVGTIAQHGLGTVDECRKLLGLPPHPDPAEGAKTAGQQPQPQQPGAGPNDPLAALAAHAGGGDPADADAPDPDEDGPGLPDPARRAAPVERLAGLRAKGFTLPPPVWRGGAA